MKCANQHLAASLAAGILLACALPMVDRAGDEPADQVPPEVILRLSQARYDALTNYVDEGKTLGMVGTNASAPCAYTIKLARPNLYRIAWDQDCGAYIQKGAAWSSGAGDFLRMGDKVQKEPNLQQVLSGAAGMSGGAAASIPCAFFKLPWANPLGGADGIEQRLPDAHVGSVDCCVVAWDNKGITTTLWIGKHDFLIHQVQRVTSAEVVKARLAAVAKQDPKLAAALQTEEPQAVTSTEVHSHILVNQALSPADFGQ